MDKVGQITYQEIAKVILNYKVANLIQLKMIEIFRTLAIGVSNLFPNTIWNTVFFKKKLSSYNSLI